MCSQEIESDIEGTLTDFSELFQGYNRTTSFTRDKGTQDVSFKCEDFSDSGKELPHQQWDLENTLSLNITINTSERCILTISSTDFTYSAFIAGKE